MEQTELNQLTYQNFDCICRFCLSNDQELSPIFKESPGDDEEHREWNDNEEKNPKNKLNVPQFVSSFTNLTILMTDVYPKFMCSKCSKLIEEFLRFRQDCIKAFDFLEKVNSIYSNQLDGDEHDYENSPDDSQLEIKEEIEEDVEMKQTTTQNEEKSLITVNIRPEPKSKKKPAQTRLTKRTKKTEEKKTKPKKSIHSYGSQGGVCDVCGKSSKYLASHMKTHESERNYVCRFCGKDFTVKAYLDRHLEIHLNLKRYKCHLCEKGFNDPNSLRVHLVVHTGEKKYSCSICERPFNNQSSMRRHLLTHTQERKFECTVCNMKFALSCRLKKHMRIHTGERPYQCKFCEKRFSMSYNCLVHMRGVHRDLYNVVQNKTES